MIDHLFVQLAKQTKKVLSDRVSEFGTGTTFLAEPMKSFYLQKSIKLSTNDMSYVTIPDFGLANKATIETWINTTGSALPQTMKEPGLRVYFPMNEGSGIRVGKCWIDVDRVWNLD
ncbi:MAG: hypothetical protein IPO26_21750 [Saprospiraceae bacterium]|nr:hypothetical protein [Saprospiraceae bacterium]